VADALRIAIDASRTTVTRLTGTEHYALALIRALIAQNMQHHFTLYFRDAPPAGLFPQSAPITRRVIPFRRAWTHLRFAAAIWRDRPDVTFVPAHTLPFVFPGRAVVTAHDLGFKHFPEAHPARSRFYLDLTTRYSTHRAAVVLADSQATADDLGRFYGTPADKIHVVYPGVDAPPINPVDGGAKYSLPARYFIFIGTLQPRKNIQRIVQAYKGYRQQTATDPVGLVLAGGQGWLYDPAWTAGVEGVHLPGYIDEADKGALLAGAVALVFPTLYEGFGFPVVEAMHCGTPVVTSITASLPELAGDAALTVDPLDVEAITAALLRLDEDAALRADLAALGEKQAARFTWARAAQQTLTALEAASKRKR
jgi:glycosyltransferase involved in cell wall biosynthesis